MTRTIPASTSSPNRSTGKPHVFTRAALTSVVTLCLLLGLLSTPAVAQQTNAGVHRSVINRLLLVRRGFPTRKQFYRTGKKRDTNKILIDIAGHRRIDNRIRLNAIRALEYFPTRRSKESLMSMVYAKRQKAAYISTCLRSLTRAFGVQMYFEVLPFLQDTKAAVRAGAAIALAEIDDPRVQGILMNHLSNEKSLTVRMVLEKALTMVKKRTMNQLRKRTDTTTQPEK